MNHDKIGKFNHVAVLFAECMTALNIKPDGIYVDCTAGGGGHSSGILSRLGRGGRLLAFDKDPQARQAAEAKLRTVETEATFEMVAADFADLANELDKRGISKVDGILADLGVSSYQLDTGERGFAFRLDGPLDMRMNPERGRTAADILATAGRDELIDIFRNYGEERYAALIANRIIKYRSTAPLTATGELVDLIYQAMPASARREKQHPAKRVFQALRIAVNDELGALESLLATIPLYLRSDGRAAIITFHSLEDRLVKQNYKEWEKPCHCPKGLPCICGKLPLGTARPGHGIVATAEEIATNPRSRSARVRVFVRNNNEPK